MLHERRSRASPAAQYADLLTTTPRTYGEAPRSETPPPTAAPSRVRDPYSAMKEKPYRFQQPAPEKFPSLHADVVKFDSTGKPIGIAKPPRSRGQPCFADFIEQDAESTLSSRATILCPQDIPVQREAKGRPTEVAAVEYTHRGSERQPEPTGTRRTLVPSHRHAPRDHTMTSPSEDPNDADAEVEDQRRKKRNASTSSDQTMLFFPETQKPTMKSENHEMGESFVDPSTPPPVVRSAPAVEPKKRPERTAKNEDIADNFSYVLTHGTSFLQTWWHSIGSVVEDISTDVLDLCDGMTGRNGATSGDEMHVREVAPEPFPKKEPSFGEEKEASRSWRHGSDESRQKEQNQSAGSSQAHNQSVGSSQALNKGPVRNAREPSTGQDSAVRDSTSKDHSVVRDSTSKDHSVVRDSRGIQDSGAMDSAEMAAPVYPLSRDDLVTASSGDPARSRTRSRELRDDHDRMQQDASDSEDDWQTGHESRDGVRVKTKKGSRVMWREAAASIHYIEGELPTRTRGAKLCDNAQHGVRLDQDVSTCPHHDDRGSYREDGAFPQNGDRGSYRDDRGMLQHDDRGSYREYRDAFPSVDRGSYRDDRGTIQQHDDRGSYREDRDRGLYRDDRGSFPQQGDRGSYRDDKGSFPQQGDRGSYRDDRGSFQHGDRGSYRDERGTTIPQHDNRQVYREDRGSLQHDNRQVHREERGALPQSSRSLSSSWQNTSTGRGAQSRQVSSSSRQIDDDGTVHTTFQYRRQPAQSRSQPQGSSYGQNNALPQQSSRVAQVPQRRQATNIASHNGRQRVYEPEPDYMDEWSDDDYRDYDDYSG